LAASFQEGTEASSQASSITSGKKKKKPLEKVSTKPSQEEGFRVS